MHTYQTTLACTVLKQLSWSKILIGHRLNEDIEQCSEWGIEQKPFQNSLRFAKKHRWFDRTYTLIALEVPPPSSGYLLSALNSPSSQTYCAMNYPASQESGVSVPTA